MEPVADQMGPDSSQQGKGGRERVRNACMLWAGAQVDNTQMLPSPFDNVHGGANAVSHIPSSMQQSSAEGDKAAGDLISDLSPPLTNL